MTSTALTRLASLLRETCIPYSKGYTSAALTEGGDETLGLEIEKQLPTGSGLRLLNGVFEGDHGVCARVVRENGQYAVLVDIPENQVIEQALREGEAIASETGANIDWRRDAGEALLSSLGPVLKSLISEATTLAQATMTIADSVDDVVIVGTHTGSKLAGIVSAILGVRSIAMESLEPEGFSKSKGFPGTASAGNGQEAYLANLDAQAISGGAGSNEQIADLSIVDAGRPGPAFTSSKDFHWDRAGDLTDLGGLKAGQSFEQLLCGLNSGLTWESKVEEFGRAEQSPSFLAGVATGGSAVGTPKKDGGDLSRPGESETASTSTLASEFIATTALAVSTSNAAVSPVQLHRYSALADEIYVRDGLDQALILEDDIDGISAASPAENTAILLGLPVDAGLRLSGDYFYSDRGFVARVVKEGSGFVVVFRGVDTATLSAAELGSALTGEHNRERVDGHDITQVVAMGIGTIAESQAADALNLTKAVIDFAGSENVVVVGQSLGGGLAGVVSAVHNVSGVAFAPAPFEAQIGAEAQREAARNITKDYESAFQSSFFSLSLTEKVIVLQQLGTPNHFPGSQGTYTEMFLNVSHWSSASQIRSEFIADSDSLKSNYLAQIQANLSVHTIEGEALSSGAFAGIIDLGSEHFPVLPTPYDVGDGGRWALHSPTLHMLVIRTDKLEGKEFAELLKNDNQLRFAFLGDRPEISGPIDHARVDPDANTTSKVGSSGPNPMVPVRALWKAVGDEGGLYDYFYKLFDENARGGAAAEGLNSDGRSIHSGVTKLVLGVLRDAVDETRTIEELKEKIQQNIGLDNVSVNFAGGDKEGSPFDDRIVVYLDGITNLDELVDGDKVYQEASGRPLGVSEIDEVIWTETFESFSYLGLKDFVKTSQVLGVSLAELRSEAAALGNQEAAEAKLSPWTVLVVQAGTVSDALGTDAEHWKPEERDENKSHALILGDGNDFASGGKASDYILGRKGQDVLSGEEGNDLVVGGGGEDQLFGGRGEDWVLGGAGNDVVAGGDGPAAGDTDKDYLDGGAGADVVIAGTGDTIAPGEAEDRLFWNVYDPNPEKVDRYRLEGGDKQGYAYHPNDPIFLDAPHVGKHRETYEVVDGDLIITLPDEANPITIEDWEPGDYGIQLRNLVTSRALNPELDVDLSLLAVGTPVAPGGAGFALLATVFAQLAAHDPWANFRLPDGGLVSAWYYPDDLPWFDSDGDGQPDFDGLDNTRNGTEGDDEMGGTSGDDKIVGGGGDDSLSGGGGRDFLLGGVGRDVLKGDAGADQLEGGSGADELRGGTGDDRLKGGKGDDTLG
ncbi:MAG: hypothetical protein MJA83_01775, partial [Gammaproteobacteria bacterium]|nr:hypothetical protein [Gammaproteobacteria bacterium]